MKTIKLTYFDYIVRLTLEIEKEEQETGCVYDLDMPSICSKSMEADIKKYQEQGYKITHSTQHDQLGKVVELSK